MEWLRGFIGKKEDTVVNLNESQIALLREQAESFLVTEDGQRAFRELYALDGMLHGWRGLIVNSHEPEHLYYSNMDYKRHPKKFIVTNYLHTFYVTDEDILITKGSSFQHRFEIEKRLRKKIPAFDEKLMEKTIRTIDGAIANIRDTDINFFVLANVPVAYREDTLKKVKDGLERKGYLLLSVQKDKNWEQTQLQRPEYKEYAHWLGMELWGEKIDYSSEHPDMKYPEFRYNWELI